MITGSRDWFNEKAIREALEELDLDNGGFHTLVSGGCPTGADFIAEEWAHALGWQVERHLANWAEFGKAAGPRRNAEMVKSGVDICLAAPLPQSRGTVDCMDRARDAGIVVLVIKP
jgi:hypothetical protein